jgi:hypothetical protein
VKITDNLDSSPVNVQPTGTYAMTLKNGQSWDKLISVTENQVGSYWVVFELYTYNPADGGSYQFTYNQCVLPIQVVSQA